MTFPDESDRALRQLQILTPDPSRASRVRTRCHARLARVRSRSAPVRVDSGFTRRVLAPAAVGGLGALYLVSLVATLLRLTRGL